MPGLLQATKHHDLDEAADVQTGRRRIKPDIAGNDLRLRERIKTRRIGHLVDIAARIEQAEQIGFIVGHWRTHSSANVRSQVRLARQSESGNKRANAKSFPSS